MVAGSGQVRGPSGQGRGGGLVSFILLGQTITLRKCEGGIGRGPPSGPISEAELVWGPAEEERSGDSCVLLDDFGGFVCTSEDGGLLREVRAMLENGDFYEKCLRVLADVQKCERF